MVSNAIDQKWDPLIATAQIEASQGTTDLAVATVALLSTVRTVARRQERALLTLISISSQADLAGLL